MRTSDSLQRNRPTTTPRGNGPRLHRQGRPNFFGGRGRLLGELPFQQLSPVGLPCLFVAAVELQLPPLAENGRRELGVGLPFGRCRRPGGQLARRRAKAAGPILGEAFAGRQPDGVLKFSSRHAGERWACRLPGNGSSGVDSTSLTSRSTASFSPAGSLSANSASTFAVSTEKSVG